MTTNTHKDTGGEKGRRRRIEKCHSLFLGVATPLAVFHARLLSMSGAVRESIPLSPRVNRPWRGGGGRRRGGGGRREIPERLNTYPTTIHILSPTLSRTSEITFCLVRSLVPMRSPGPSKKGRELNNPLHEGQLLDERFLQSFSRRISGLTDERIHGEAGEGDEFIPFEGRSGERGETSDMEIGREPGKGHGSTLPDDKGPSLSDLRPLKFS
ncbi:unnamed protein product [Pleuronectes platessa]|uniref:Uncharacterized protein n=1 Tax=Pleuronectes platessa TaxID=8262 RepID=A0A9N7V0C7_PLEPL|nr:unnamed protein product [Pleuronectes platessa]